MGRYRRLIKLVVFVEFSIGEVSVALRCESGITGCGVGLAGPRHAGRVGILASDRAISDVIREADRLTSRQASINFGVRTFFVFSSTRGGEGCRRCPTQLQYIRN